MSRITYDTFFNGRLRVAQPVSGYRYSLDAILLAALPHPKAGQSLLDLGTGCGIIPLILAFRHDEVVITGIEVQPELARLAAMNASNNGLQDRIRIIHEDLRRLSLDMVDGPVDWVISNPPYRRAASGRINPNSQRALARHEINVNLQQLINAGERAVDLLGEMRSAGLEPKWLQGIHSQAGDTAKLVLVQGVMGGKPGLRIEAPLVIYEADGEYSGAVQAMMRP